MWDRNRTKSPSSHTAGIGFSVLWLEQTKNFKNSILKLVVAESQELCLIWGSSLGPWQVEAGKVLRVLAQ